MAMIDAWAVGPGGYAAGAAWANGVPITTVAMTVAKNNLEGEMMCSLGTVSVGSCSVPEARGGR